jgi:hypothetical protein
VPCAPVECCDAEVELKALKQLYLIHPPPSPPRGRVPFGSMRATCPAYRGTLDHLGTEPDPLLLGRDAMAECDEERLDSIRLAQRPTLSTI